VAAAFWKAELNHKRAADLAAWEADCNAQLIAGRRTRYVIDHRFWWFRADSPVEAEQSLELTPGALANVTGHGFESATVPAESIVKSAGPGSVKLYFRDGVFRLAEVIVPPLPARPNQAAYISADRICNALLFVAPFVWLGAMLAGWSQRAMSKPHFAAFGFAAATVGTSLWAARPGAFMTTGGRIVLGIGMAMTFFALAVMRRQWHTFHTRQLHLCEVCGYELRGNVSGICPECGAVTYDGVRRQHEQRAAASAELVANMTVGDELDLQ
jgi:hypothetical protein